MSVPARPHLWVAAVVSVVLHGVGGVTAMRMEVGGDADAGNVMAWTARGQAAAAPLMLDWAAPETVEPEVVVKSEPPRLEIAPEPVPRPAEEELRLGIDKSDQATTNVMGFADPTMHAARESEVDQPALDPMPGGGGTLEPGAPGAPSAATAPSAEAPEPSMSPPEQPEALPRPPMDVGEMGPPLPPESEMRARMLGQGDEEREALPEILEGADAPENAGEGPPKGEHEPKPAMEKVTPGKDVSEPDRGADEKSREARKSVTGAAPRPPSVPAPSRPPVPMVQPAAGAGGDAGAGGGAVVGPVGEESEKEADAASRAKPIEVVLGRPAAGEGLEIITKRPKRNPFSLVTRVTAMPSNPVIEVQFDRTGRVFAAKITKSSGVADVDGPVLAAVYSWTAQGKRLDEVMGRDPAAVLTVVVTILLR